MCRILSDGHSAISCWCLYVPPGPEIRRGATGCLFENGAEVVRIPKSNGMGNIAGSLARGVQKALGKLYPLAGDVFGKGAAELLAKQG